MRTIKIEVPDKCGDCKYNNVLFTKVLCGLFDEECQATIKHEPHKATVSNIKPCSACLKATVREGK